MCGICGIVNFSYEGVREASLRKMMNRMKHRGPDDEGIFLEENIGLGFVRLSIIDLSPAGHQPMLSHDGRYVIVFNGEIYNYIELRQELKSLGHNFRTNSDTEVLLTAWEQWGEESLHKFNGMWAFVVYDRKEKSIFASRDRYGVKPFYYLLTEEFLAFSSEIPPLLELIKAKPTPDYQSIFEYLVFSRTDQTERTFFKEIRKLQHGYSFSYKYRESGDSMPGSIKKWYDVRSRVEGSAGFNDPEEFQALLESSIGLRLRSDVPVGVCLSGGLDSSAILSIIVKKFGITGINTFSAVYNEGQHGDESKFIRLFRTNVGNMFFTTPDASGLESDINSFIRTHAEPIGTASPYAQFKVMELASRHVVVTLDGQGADEQLAGYHYFFGFYFKDLLRQLKFGKLASELVNYTAKHHGLLGIKSFLFFLLPPAMRTKNRIEQSSFIDPDFAASFTASNVISDNLYGSHDLKDSLLNHFDYKLEHLLKWEDRNSMHFSLEARVPFLDYRLVEKTLATRTDFIIRSGMTKHIMREAMKGILPEEIRMRRDKTGFDTPSGEWFRNINWQKEINEIIASRLFKERKIISPAKAEGVLKTHISGRKNLEKNIWKLINLEYWFREFID